MLIFFHVYDKPVCQIKLIKHWCPKSKLVSALEEQKSKAPQGDAIFLE